MAPPGRSALSRVLVNVFLFGGRMRKEGMVLVGLMWRLQDVVGLRNVQKSTLYVQFYLKSTTARHGQSMR